MNDGTIGPRGDRDRDSDDGNEERASRSERVLMAMSAAFTLLLFAFVIWQALTAPAVEAPTATVKGTETLPNGAVKVTVAFRNAQDVGLVHAVVEVDCDDPPPELTFEHIPVDDRQDGYVICPPGTEDPTATVSTWIEA